jgi:hypothetical protein
MASEFESAYTVHFEQHDCCVDATRHSESRCVLSEGLVLVVGVLLERKDLGNGPSGPNWDIGLATGLFSPVWITPGDTVLVYWYASLC